MGQKIDADVKAMTERQLRLEVMRMRTGVRRELSHTGNHRCWVNLLKTLPEGKTLKALSLPRCEFLGNCAAYFDRNQPQRKRR
jgi:hypothetical protein